MHVCDTNIKIYYLINMNNNSKVAKRLSEWLKKMQKFIYITIYKIIVVLLLFHYFQVSCFIRNVSYRATFYMNERNQDDTRERERQLNRPIVPIRMWKILSALRIIEFPSVRLDFSTIAHARLRSVSENKRVRRYRHRCQYSSRRCI